MNEHLRNERGVPPHWEPLAQPELVGSLVEIEVETKYTIAGPLRGIRHIKHGDAAIAVTTLEWGVRIDPEPGKSPVPYPSWHFVCPDLVVPQRHVNGKLFFYVDCCKRVTIDPTNKNKLLTLEKCRRIPNDGMDALFEAMVNIRYVLYGHDDEGESELAADVREAAKIHDLGIRSDYLESILAA